MERKSITINYIQTNISELNNQDRELLFQAEKAIDNSYSPYSHFKVGSALLLSNGDYVRGANQENSAYPSGLCAERVALFSWGTNYGDNNVVAIAICAKNNSGEFCVAYPCGSCLQVMVETEIRTKEKLRFLVQINDSKVEIFEGVESLLPFSFSL